MYLIITDYHCFDTMTIIVIIIIITSHRYPFCVFFNESRRTKVPKPYYSREKACQVEHFEAFRKVIGAVHGL